MDDATRNATRELVRSRFRSIPDFPKPGILFRDLMPVLADSEALAAGVDLHVDAAARITGDGLPASMIVGMESRGFLFGMTLAARLRCGFAPVRKPGKLPGATITESYALEYGDDTLEMQEDAVKPDSRVLIVDDLLATGGTAEATVRLVRRLGATVIGCVFLVELEGLGGADRLAGVDVAHDAILKF